MYLLEKRLGGVAVNVRDEADASKARYAELLVY